MINKLLIRRDVLANFIAQGVILDAGEPAYTLDDGLLRVGDGVSAFDLLPTFALVNDVQAALDGLVTAQQAVNDFVLQLETAQTDNATAFQNLQNGIDTQASQLEATNGAITALDSRTTVNEQAVIDADARLDALETGGGLVEGTRIILNSPYNTIPNFVPHGLGKMPKFAQLVAECIQASQGYNVGDFSTVNANFVFGYDAVNSWLIRASGGGTYTIWNKTTGASFSISNSTSWRLVLRTFG